MLKIKFIFVFFFSISSFLNAGAQERFIYGTVTTFDSIPLIGASISVKSTKQVVLSDTVGNFSILCSDEDQLVVSAKGFYSQKIKLSSNIKFAAVNLKMKSGEKNREYALGYGNVSDRDKLNALASVSNDEIDFSIYNNIFDAIKGRFAGVDVIDGEIIIRGLKSLGASNAALIVLDGTVINSNALYNIPPNQVKSINVIKDGGSAVYGSRGANGVVIIQTKRGDE